MRPDPIGCSDAGHIGTLNAGTEEDDDVRAATKAWRATGAGSS